MYKDTYEIWLKGVSEAERAELEAIKHDDNEQKERFSLELAFGTAGMRGEARKPLRAAWLSLTTRADFRGNSR